MMTDHSLRDVLISNSRAHAQQSLNHFIQVPHTGALAAATAGLLLACMLLPRRTRLVATAFLTATGVWAARAFFRHSCAQRWCETTDTDEPAPELSRSLVDLHGQQSFPASDPPGNV